jgi:hypothetical protein
MVARWIKPATTLYTLEYAIATVRQHRVYHLLIQFEVAHLTKRSSTLFPLTPKHLHQYLDMHSRLLILIASMAMSIAAAPVAVASSDIAKSASILERQPEVCRYVLY